MEVGIEQTAANRLDLAVALEKIHDQAAASN
jgi:hypothetical protein